MRNLPPQCACCGKGCLPLDTTARAALCSTCFNTHRVALRAAGIQCAGVDAQPGNVILWQFDPTWVRMVLDFPYVPAAPVDPLEAKDLLLIGAGKAWKVKYARVEQLIERGYVTCTGATLTKKGAERAKDG